MCATSYQRKHVSMDDGSDGDDGDKKFDDFDFDDDENSLESREARKKNRRRLLMYILVGLVIAVVVCALLIPRGSDSNNNNVYADDGDDDLFADTDDDSLFYHGEPEDEDPKEIVLEDDGAANIELVSKATMKSKNITSGCETTILLMRHCEKIGDDTVDENGDEHCDYVGMERAHWIPSLFGPGARWPSPSYLYALSPTRGSHMTFREVETVKPLAKKFGLPIHKEFGTNNGVIDAVFNIMSTGETCGKLIVINWRHHMIPNLARKLGCKSCPKAYPEHSFDEVWQLKLVWDVANTPVHRQDSHGVPSTPPKLRRRLKKTIKAKKAKHKAVSGTKKAKSTYKGPLWSVYSTVTNQFFDPLQFSGSVGDYQENGSKIGASWLNFEEGEM